MKKRLFFILILSTIATEVSLASSSNEPYYAVIIDSTQKLNEDMQGNGNDILSLAGHFGLAYDVLNEAVAAGSVQIEIKGKRGWVNEDAILLKKKAPAPSIDAKKEGNLDRKVIVVNQLKAKNHPVRIPLYDNPNLSGKPISETTIFELRYLFAEINNAALVGKTDRLVKGNADDVLSGWIDKSRHMYEWNNRIGIEFDKNTFTQRRQNLGAIFVSARDIKRHKSGKAQPIYQEENTSTPMPYYANRFPVLNKMKEAYHVVYIGGGYGTEKNYTHKDIEIARRDGGRIIQNKRVRVAILVDATKGMQSHIGAVKKALQKFVKELKADETIEIEVAVAVYRDYADGEKIYEIVSPFTRNYQSVIRAVGAITAFSSKKDRGVGTFTEAMFYGMDHSINWDWGGNIIDKYMILIGDHGNHENSKQYSQNAPYTLSGVKSKLEQKKIALYAVQVNITDKNKRHWNKLFEKQIKQIVGEENPFGGLQKVKKNSQSAIYKALLKVYQTFHQVKTTVVMARKGLINRQFLDTPGYKGRFTQLILERYGINPDIFKAVQACATGYVSKNNRGGTPQIEEKVLMSKRGINRLKVQIGDLASAIFYYDRVMEDELEKTIMNVVKALTGDKPKPNEEIADFIDKKAGIPIQTEWLQGTVEDLVERVNDSDPDVRNEFVQYLRKKEILLEQVLKEERLEIGEWQEDDGIYVFDSTGQKQPYLFSFEQPLMIRIKNNKMGNKLKMSQKTHVWLPFEFLP